MQILMEPFASLDDYLAWVGQRPAEEHYEVVNGFAVMSPSPTGWHQGALAIVWGLLRDACPPSHIVLPAPLDWVLWEVPRLQIREPDIVVVALEEVRAPRLTVPPLLAVEVLSPGSVERDAVAKRREYAKAGLDHFWIVDAETPQVAVYRRDGEDYERVAHAIGDAELQVDHPLRVRLRPSDLVI